MNVMRLFGILFLLGGLLPAPISAQSVMLESNIRVQVQGLVRRPGLYTLYQGARAADAIQAAGGIRPGAELSGLNLAALLKDGDSLTVSAHRPLPSSPPHPVAPGARRAKRTSAPRLGPGSKGIDLNTAGIDQLDALPGIGAALAADIIAYRQSHGRFRSLDELREVPGIGERRLARLKPLLKL